MGIVIMECYNMNLCLYVKMRIKLQKSLDMPLFPDSMAHLFHLITSLSEIPETCRK